MAGADPHCQPRSDPFLDDRSGRCRECLDPRAPVRRPGNRHHAVSHDIGKRRESADSTALGNPPTDLYEQPVLRRVLPARCGRLVDESAHDGRAPARGDVPVDGFGSADRDVELLGLRSAVARQVRTGHERRPGPPRSNPVPAPRISRRQPERSTPQRTRRGGQAGIPRDTSRPSGDRFSPLQPARPAQAAPVEALYAATETPPRA